MIQNSNRTRRKNEFDSFVYHKLIIKQKSGTSVDRLECTNASRCAIVDIYFYLCALIYQELEDMWRHEESNLHLHIDILSINWPQLVML